MRREALPRDAAACAAGGLIVLVPFALWIVTLTSPSEYWFLNWTLNSHFLNHFGFLKRGLEIFSEGPLLFAFAGLALTLPLRDRRHWELAALAGMLLAPLLVVRAPTASTGCRRCPCWRRWQGTAP